MKRVRLVLAAAIGASLFVAGSTAQVVAETGVTNDAKQFVVVIRGDIGGTPTFGSGIIVGMSSNELYIATANHVVRSQGRVVTGLQLQFFALPARSLPATVLPKFDKSIDLAILSVPNSSEVSTIRQALRFDRLASGPEIDQLPAANSVYIAGNPTDRGLTASVTPENILDRDGTTIEVQSGLLAGGFSGGAVFDTQMKFVGMIQTDTPPAGRALRADVLLRTLRHWNIPVSLTPPASRPSPTPIPGRTPEPGFPSDWWSSGFLSGHAYRTFSYASEMRSGDCRLVQQRWVLRDDGRGKFEGTMWTHTVSGDIWHADVVIVRDKTGDQPGGHVDSPRFFNSDPAQPLRWQFDFSFNAGSLADVRATRLTNNSC